MAAAMASLHGEACSMQSQYEAWPLSVLRHTYGGQARVP